MKKTLISTITLSLLVGFFAGYVLGTSRRRGSSRPERNTRDILAQVRAAVDDEELGAIGIEALLSHEGYLNLTDRIRDLRVGPDCDQLSPKEVITLMVDAALLSESYAILSGQLMLQAREQGGPTADAAIVSVGQATRNEGLALAVVASMDTWRPNGWENVLRAWINPGRLRPSFVAVRIVQDMAGENWGLSWAPSRSEPGNEAMWKAMDYLESVRDEGGVPAQGSIADEDER